MIGQKGKFTDGQSVTVVEVQGRWLVVQSTNGARFTVAPEEFTQDAQPQPEQDAQPQPAEKPRHVALLMSGTALRAFVWSGIFAGRERA
jgi:anti-sigma factor RsiW